MRGNIEAIDRVIRIVAGIALLGVVVFVPGPWRWVGLIGLVPLITGLVGWCPVYAMFSRD